MRYTQEQVIAMSEHDINCAIYEEKNTIESYSLFSRMKKMGMVMNEFPAPRYCNDPRLYMPLVIENEIDITFSDGKVECCGSGFYFDRKPKSETGRAVCEAFLTGID